MKVRDRQQFQECFGRSLRAIREGQGISQNQLAQRAGVAQGTVTFYENARRRPTLDLTVDLLHALGYPMDAFMEEVLACQAST